MKNRNLFTRLPLLAVAMCLLGGNAHAVLIDDFNGADFTVPDPDIGIEVPQPYANAIGGWRVLLIGGSFPGDSLAVSGGVLTQTEAIAEASDRPTTSTVFWEGSPAVKSLDPPVDLTDGGSSDRVRVDITAVDPRCIYPAAEFEGELRMTVRNGSCSTELTQGLGQAGPYDFPFADFRVDGTCPFDGFENVLEVRLEIQTWPRPNEDAIACMEIDNIETVGPPQGNQAPTADAGGPYSGKVGTDMGFDGSGSSDPEGTALTYNWAFGDDGIGFGAFPGYLYTAPGTYHVTLTVTDESGVPASTSTTANVGGLSQQPVADAGGPYTGTVNVPVDFDGSGSSDPEGAALTYDWDFGDGTVVEDAGPTPSHAYSLAVKYTVTLTVTNEFGEDNAIVTYATIANGNQSPVADPNGPYTGAAGELISFDGSGSSDPDGSIVRYDWDFGDGSPVAVDAGANPFYSYAAAGFYHVTLTVTDDLGVSNSATTVAGIKSGDALDCSTAVPSTDVIWPPNFQFIAIDVLGVTDLGGDPASITIDSIFQDEPVGIRVDGMGVGTDTASVRAQRSSWRRGGNGRVYHIGFTADDGQGGSCTGNVTVSVPILPFFDAVDDGANFDSTVTGN